MVSSKETSAPIFLVALKCINISLSMHLETYVDNFTFLLGLKLFIPFINPIVPIEIKSSWLTLAATYFLQT